ncbi:MULTISPECIES: ABC transporter permease [Clostridium]|uniref:ABC transporter permease n=1 Tax=Clostridium TaxID=1485 RepID=UPI00082554B1|nr:MULTISPECIES: ABC transporter permease [Clostridium]
MIRLLKLISLDLKLLSKTKVFYIKLILFPIAIVLILGTAFGSQDSTKPVSKFQVGICSEDSTVTENNQNFSLGETLKNDVLDSKDAKTYFSIIKVNSYSEGEKMVKDKKIAAFVYVPKNFTKAYLDNTETNISLIADNSSIIDKMIVKNILNEFNQSINTIRIEENEVLSNAPLKTHNLQSIISKIQNTDYSSDISTTSTNKDIKPTSVMTYCTIGIAVMFSILTALELAHGIVEDKLNNTQFRIKTTPTKDIQYALGKIFGMILAITVQMFIILTACHLIFGASLGNPLYLFIITICYGFTVGSIVFCASTVSKNQTSISSYASLILWGLSVLGGSIIQKTALPGAMQKIQQIVPNGKAINCYLRVCEGSNFSSNYVDLIELLGLGLIFLIIALHFYSAKNSTKLIEKGDNENVKNDKKTIKAAV